MMCALQQNFVIKVHLLCDDVIIFMDFNYDETFCSGFGLDDMRPGRYHMPWTCKLSSKMRILIACNHAIYFIWTIHKRSTGRRITFITTLLGRECETFFPVNISVRRSWTSAVYTENEQYSLSAKYVFLSLAIVNSLLLHVWQVYCA